MYWQDVLGRWDTFEHKPGQVMMVDFAGDNLSYVDKASGEIIKCLVFIAVLPYSGYSFAEALSDSRQPNVVKALNSCLDYFGGVSGSVKCDNMKTAMSKADYAAFLESKEIRDKILSPYESFVHDRLNAHPAVSAAQMHDWLKEYHPDFVHIAPKTVYNFVIALRQKYNIPLEEMGREYFAVEELPYGQQAQADFGHYILRGTEESRKRIHFFVMMLSRSRMKFVQFSDYPFTTRTAIDAHEEAFRFFCGIPSEIVYDQDRLFLVEERMGELLLTQEFKDYVFEQEFQLHFCRKADPQSKGKVENVVKYVKNNFLYARPWYDLQTLQAQAMAWLQRTGNAMPRSTTRKIPLEEWQNEQPQLRPWVSVKILKNRAKRFLSIAVVFVIKSFFQDIKFSGAK